MALVIEDEARQQLLEPAGDRVEAAVAKRTVWIHEVHAEAAVAHVRLSGFPGPIVSGCAGRMSDWLVEARLTGCRTVSRPAWIAGLAVAEFSTKVESGQRLVVDRAMYSNAGGVGWAAGTNAQATKLRWRGPREAEPARGEAIPSPCRARPTGLMIRHMPSVDLGSDETLRSLIDQYRTRCLWFLREGYYPTTTDEVLRVLDAIQHHGDVDAFKRAGALRQWVSASFSAASASF